MDKGINTTQEANGKMKVQTVATILILSIVCFSTARAGSSSNEDCANPKKTKAKAGALAEDKEDCSDDVDESSCDDKSTKIVKKSKMTTTPNSSSKISLGFAFVAILAAVSML
ncbi:hypothetical protein NEMIN01_1434 [Nematocida minor]|uniref:uncharacterized protein n=1 Tax=Nematocida minor TaxID=1912983 RepID=UPI00221E87D6|nr:uncharacterized protein NEMIN01_1434 [Nematocida minor]KAI5191226.1 hypothetical protein NEMIN01_1434 [Nematocida minor]